jgi:hypothetical protein
MIGAGTNRTKPSRGGGPAIILSCMNHGFELAGIKIVEMGC